MKRYLIAKDGEYYYTWDSKKGIMYKSLMDGEYADVVDFNLQQLSKFIPTLKEVENTDKKPVWIPISTEEDNKKKKQ